MQNHVETVRPPEYPIASVDKALQLLSRFGEGRTMRVSEAAEELQTARSTAHRLLAMLEYHGFVRQQEAGRAYEPGPKLVALALSAIGSYDIRRLARLHLERLCEQVGETVHLVGLDGRSGVFLDSVETSQALRVGARVGIVMPLHCTAGGKAILVQLPRETLHTLYGDGALERMTDRSIADLGALERELEEVRRCGFATNFGESEEGIGAVAVPVPGRLADRPVSITVSAPLTRLDDDRVAEIAAAATETAAAIGRERG